MHSINNVIIMVLFIMSCIICIVLLVVLSANMTIYIPNHNGNIHMYRHKRNPTKHKHSGHCIYIDDDCIDTLNRQKKCQQVVAIECCDRHYSLLGFIDEDRMIYN